MPSNHNLLRESIVYAFYVPSINAIKVGFGASGRSRMREYSRQYQLSSNAQSLRQWKLPSSSIASAIEVACHEALLCAGFARINHSIDQREAQELFDLGSFTYDEALLVVAEAIDETVAALYTALAKQRPLEAEKARVQSEAARKRREALSAEREARYAKVQEDFLNIVAGTIAQRWKQEAEPFVKACETAKNLMKSFPSNQGVLSTLFEGRKSEAVRMQNWPSWPSIKKLVWEIFNTGRAAKRLYSEMEKKYANSAEPGAQKLGLSIWSPHGYHLPLVNHCGDTERDHREVMLVVQLATGMRWSDAEELVKRDPDLLGLMKFAKENPPPELEPYDGLVSWEMKHAPVA